MDRRSLPAPKYTGTRNRGMALAVESMKRHMTDEGWQVMAGLWQAGYDLAGHNLPVDSTDVRQLLSHDSETGVVVVQDKREWDVGAGNFRDPDARFENIEYLAQRDDLFKLTILKDAHQNPPYHSASAQEIGCHAWIVNYREDIVHTLAPYTRRRHLIRVYHTVDRDVVPQYRAEGREGCLLSGAVSGAYPLRSSLVTNRTLLPETTYLPHPGYHRNGSDTPSFLKLLSRFKVSICTASRYGYALRKIFESVACGCVVITDLPREDVLPEIDRCLVRIPAYSTPRQVADVIAHCLASYEPEKQRHYAEKAREFYDYRTAGLRLATDIEALRLRYNDGGRS